MNTIQSEAGSATFVNNHTVLIRMNEGSEVDHELAKRSNSAIADAMPGDYGMIIDRQADYSTTPVQVFQILNNIPTLQAIAIVAYRASTEEFTKLEQRLSTKPLAVFNTVEDAQAWIDQILNQDSTSSHNTHG